MSWSQSCNRKKKKTGGQTAHEYGHIMLSQSLKRWNKDDNKVILLISMTNAHSSSMLPLSDKKLFSLHYYIVHIQSFRITHGVVA